MNGGPTPPGRDDDLAPRGIVEDGLLEPNVPHVGAPPPHVLTNRPFLWLVLGSGVASIAFWAYFGTLFADAAFRFEATATDAALLLASFSVPFVLVTPLAGIWVDRWSPKWVLFLGFVLLAAAIPVALLADSIVWLAVSILVVGVAAAALDPARSALTGLLVEERLLVQANGMLSTAFHGALLIGTLGGGLLIESRGADTVYTVATVIAVLGLPGLLLVPDARQRGDRPHMTFRDLAQGLQIAWHHPELRLLLSMAVSGYVLMNMLFSLEPLLIRDVIGGGPQAVQFIWAANGLGAVLGALTVSRIRHGVGLELVLVGGGLVVTGVGLAVYAGVGTYAVALGGSVVIGVGFSFFFTSALALVQRAAGEESRGRVTAVLGVLQEGTGLVSAIALASVGALVAVQPVLVGSGVLLVVVGTIGWRRLLSLQRAGLAAVPRQGAAAAVGLRGRRRG
ncbi:MAG TPA: MFS transporter [Actinomycetota bacterium]|nr:MFS transporter [Actinomycetota bacterium]